ncbi:putative disease resistance protein RGA4 [Bienertia sinuspersici]
MIILDDIWDDILDVTWQKLLISLKLAALGITIIVTTHNEHIARNLHPILTLQLHQLPDDDAWTLFKALAFGDPQSPPEGNFETIGKKPVEKYRGLPLAITTLGRLLSRFLFDPIEWENITSKKFSETMEHIGETYFDELKEQSFF